MSIPQDGWIPSAEWCAKYKEAAPTVRRRVQDGAWKRGVHWAAPDGGCSYVHEPRCRQWLIERGKLK
jgi:hypothetical protein